MRQDRKISHPRQKRCLWCRELFKPDKRIKRRQRYCSKTECQTKRQRENERIWRIKNPDCLAYQHEQSLKWHRAHPNYNRERRRTNFDLVQKNRYQTKIRMRKIRTQKMFDKSKVILAQLVEKQQVKCYLTMRHRWLIVRLTKASPLSKLSFMRDNHTRVKRVSNHLPRGHLYDLSGIF